MQQQFFTMAELAVMFGVTHRTIQKWVGTGKLPHFKSGRVVRVRREWVERFVNAHLKE